MLSERLHNDYNLQINRMNVFIQKPTFASRCGVQSWPKCCHDAFYVLINKPFFRSWHTAAGTWPCVSPCVCLPIHGFANRRCILGSLADTMMGWDFLNCICVNCQNETIFSSLNNIIQCLLHCNDTWHVVPTLPTSTVKFCLHTHTHTHNTYGLFVPFRYDS